MRTVITRRTIGFTWDERHVQACVIRSGIAETVIEKLIRIPRELDKSGVPVHNVAKDIKKILEETGIKDETTVTCLNGSSFMYRILQRPFSDRKKIMDTIVPEVETLLPSLDSRISVDFVLLGKDETGSYRIVALCAPVSSVQSLDDICVDAGIAPEIVDCPSVAVASGARMLFNLPNDINLIVVNMGWTETSVGILYGNTIKYLGALPFGFEKITPQIPLEDETGAAALMERIQSGTVEGGESLKAFFREILIMLERVGELEGELAILNTGYTGLIRDFSTRAEEIAGITVLKPSLKDIQFEGEMDDLLFSFLSVSLACRGFDETDQVNLRQGEPGLKKHMKFLKGFSMSWIIAFVVLVLIWIFGLAMDDFLLARTNADLTNKIKTEFTSVMPKNTPMVEPAKQMEQYLARISGQTGSMGGGAGNSPLDIIKDLSVSIPGNIDVIFDSINIDESSVTLSGSTSSFNNVEKIQSALKGIPYIKEVKIVSSDVDKTDQKVKLKLVCKK